MPRDWVKSIIMKFDHELLIHAGIMLNHDELQRI